MDKNPMDDRPYLPKGKINYSDKEINFMKEDLKIDERIRKGPINFEGRPVYTEDGEAPRLPHRDSYSNKASAELIEEKRNAIFLLENEYQDLCFASETLNKKRMELLEKMNKAKTEYVNFCSDGFKYP